MATPEDQQSSQDYYEVNKVHKGLTIDQWEEVRGWWHSLVPYFKDWAPNQIKQAADYLKVNNVNPVEHLRSKFDNGTRLVVIGVHFPPSVNDLPFQILENIPNLGFIAVDARDPKDETGSLEDSDPLFLTVDVGNGMKWDLPRAEALRKYPEQFENASKRSTKYDDLVKAAQEMGISVLYTEQGSNWKEMNRLASTQITEYMREHPNERGVFFSFMFQALKWPGYETQEEKEQLEFSRPMSTEAHFLAQDPRKDESVRMPAYELEQQFPGQVYSTAQFAMPRGLGQDWKNLRSAIATSGIKEPFALDIKGTPFAEQRYIFRGAAELGDIKDEDLYKCFGTIAQGFFGPMEFLWEKVLDGVIVCPSDEPLPEPPTREEMLEAAGQFIAETVSYND